MPSSPHAARWSVFPGLAALVLYLALTPDVSGDKDGSELTLVLAFGGAAHPTGYPLYTLLGHGFASAAHGLGASWPWAANAWSALGGAVAVALLHALCAALVPEALTRRRATRFCAALAPTALFALNPIWTYETTLAEVYSWHVAWVLGAALLFLRLYRRLSVGELRRRRDAALWGLAGGLGAAHHATFALVFLPLTAVLVFAAWRRRALAWRDAALFVGAALLPLAAYASLAYRAFSPAPWSWPALGPDWGSIAGHVIGDAYQGLLGSFRPSPEQQALLARYVYPIVGPTLALFAVAAVRRRELRALLAAAALATVFAFAYGVPDPSSYFLAPMALAAAAPLAFASRSVALALVLAAGIAAAALAPGWIRAGADRKRVFAAFDARVHGMWSSIPFERAIVVFPNDLFARLVEYQLLRGEKKDLEIVNPLLLSQRWPRARFQARHGFDPMADEALRAAHAGRDAERVGEAFARALNERTSEPVVIFDPMQESVRLLRKSR